MSDPVKRYFRLDDEYCIYTVVATDLFHAQKIMDESGAEFGAPSVRLNEAVARGDDLTWSEIPSQDAAEITVYDDRTVAHTRYLTACELGDWFSSEY